MALLRPWILPIAVASSALLGWQVQRAKWWSLTTEWPLDLAFFHNIVWNLLHGHGYRQSATWHERPGLFHETHFEPIVLLATGATAVMGSVDGLFLTQSLILAAFAVPIHGLLRPLGQRVAWSGAFGVLFCWPFLRFGQADVRPLLWSIPFLGALVLGLRQRRARVAVVGALGACLCREELPVLVAATALGFLVTSRRGHRRLPIQIAGMAVLYLVVTTALRSNTSFYIRPGEWLAGLGGSSPGDDGWKTSARDLLPVRLRWLAEWLLPCWPVILAPEVLLGTLPLFAWLMTQPHEWASWEGPYIHHAAPAWALVAAGAAVGSQRLHALMILKLPRKVVGPILVSLLVLTLGASLVRAAAGWSRHTAPELVAFQERDPEVAFVHALAARVPADAAVMTDYGAVHLFAGRYAVYCYQQEEPEIVVPEVTPWAGPLLPRAQPDPTWALIRDEHEGWIQRARAMGLSEVDRGRGYTLFGPRNASPPAEDPR